MASTAIQTSTNSFPFRGNNRMARATSRIWVAVDGKNDATNPGLCLWYSDDDGGTWTKHSQLDSGTGGFSADVAVNDDASPTALYVSWGGTDQLDQPLKFASITSNVASSTPGSATTTTVDAGGSNAGVVAASMFVTKTSTRARVWIVYTKCTAATPTFEKRVAYALLSASTSWDTTTLTGLDGGSSGSFNGYFGVGTYVSISSADKALIVFNSTVSPNELHGYLFDPTAATPSLGSSNVVATYTTSSGAQPDTYGDMLAVCAKADYIVVGYYDPDLGTVTYRKSINGTSWTTPTGWSVTSGAFALSLSGSDFYIVHSETYGASASSAQALKYRLITTASDSMGSVTTFSDTNGNGVVMPRNTGTSNVYAVYRASTSSPYSVKSDIVALGGGGADSTAPAVPTVTTTAAVTGTSVTVTTIQPSDIDVSTYEVRYLTSGYPATNRSDGTVLGPTSTSPSATTTNTITSLTNGTRYYFRVFTKDTTGNWNTGTTSSIVAGVPPTVVGWYESTGTTFKSDGVAGTNPVLEWTVSSAAVEASKPASFRVRIGTDNPGANSPPTASTTDYVSTSATGSFKYYTGSAWATIPAAGVPWASINAGTVTCRYYSSLTSGTWYASIRVEQ